MGKEEGLTGLLSEHDFHKTILSHSGYLLQHSDGRFFHTTGLKDKYGRHIISRKGDEYVIGVDVEIKDLFSIGNYE